jgi:ribosomal protein S18 acetylase RimI-like enzyme
MAAADGPPLAARISVRAIAPDDLDWFGALAGDATPGLADQVRSLWDGGTGRPDWTLVALADDRPLGRLAMFAEPLGCGIDESECHLAGLWVNFDHHEHETVAAELFRAAAHRAAEVAPTLLERRLNSEVHTDIDRWRAILTANGFQLFQEKEGFVWTDTGQELPASHRLRLRSMADVGRAAFAEAMGQCIAGTLDRNDLYYLERCGPSAWGRQMVEFAERDDEASWMLGFDADGTLAGYVGVVPFEPEVATIAHIGVAPGRRGRGFVDDLLVAGTAAARARGFTAILSDVDTFNAPMIAAMERNGHLRGIRPWHVWAYRRTIPEKGEHGSLG